MKEKIVLTVIITILAVLLIAAIIGLRALNASKRKWKKFTKTRVEAHAEYLKTVRTMNAEEREKAPNIIVILADDLGMGDVGFGGSTAIETPNLDRLAADGAILSNALAASPVCTPSRFGLLTGRYPSRGIINGVYFPSVSPDKEDYFPMGYDNDGAVKGLEEPKNGSMPHINGLTNKLIGSTLPTNGILEDEILLPEILRANGYETAMFGKWHLGDKSPHLPTDKGFDYFFGTHYSNDMVPYHYWRNEEKVMDGVIDQTQLTGILTDEIIDYIEYEGDDPFFLYYASPFPHHPATASEEFQGTSGAGLFGDAVQELDWSIGQIVEKLEEKGEMDNTLIIFSSDNGPWYQGATAGQRGRKGNNFNGGQQVPTLMHWPDEIAAGGNIEGISMSIDFMPTIAKYLGIDLPADRMIDGKDILPMVNGEEDSPHDELFYIQDMKAWAVRTRENYKYYASAKPANSKYSMVQLHPYLFNLSTDPEEAYDLRNDYPDLASELRDRLAEFNREIQANPRGWLD